MWPAAAKSLQSCPTHYWSGLPFPSPGDLPDPGVELVFSVSSIGASLVAQLVKNPPAMQETPVGFLGQEDPLVKVQVFLGLLQETLGSLDLCQ